jgi:small subunit ribosomal protein S17
MSLANVEAILSKSRKLFPDGRYKVGLVVGAKKMRKTIMLGLYNKRWIPKYQVYVRTTTKIMAHDPDEICDLGDKVRVRFIHQKFSKRKNYLVDAIVEKSMAADYLNKNPEFIATLPEEHPKKLFARRFQGFQDPPAKPKTNFIDRVEREQNFRKMMKSILSKDEKKREETGKSETSN